MQVFPYGTVLKIQREDSQDDIFEKLNKIKNLNMNFVVIWPAVYWWEDKTYPNYPFHTGHEILRYAEKIGLNVIMELAGQITCLEYAPDFIMKDEYYAVTYDGHYNRSGYHYGYLNYNHPEVKSIIEKQFKQIAMNYRGYKSLYGYDIWNETMFTSFDRFTLEVFRKWLKDKYKSIENLNRAWDRVFYDWSQIEFTTWLWNSVMPLVDYEQFHKENVGIILNEWKGYIKSVDPDRPVIADNIFSMITMDPFYERPQDDWNVAENVDEFGISFYPKNFYPPFENYRRHQTFVASYCASNKKFWVSEMQTHHQCLFNPFSVVSSSDIKLWNWEAISNGAKGIIYWMWEPFIKGLQTFGRGLVDRKGEYTNRALEASCVHRIIMENEEEFIKFIPEQPKVAILYDKLNHDFTKAYTLNYQDVVSTSIYIDSISGLYKALFENNIQARFITPKDILSDQLKSYKFLFITNQLCISKELSEKIVEFVSNGGVLVCDGKFGEINNFGILNRVIPGFSLSDISGYELLDIDYKNLDIMLDGLNRKSLNLKGYHEKRYLKLSSNKVEVLGKFSDDWPAIIRSYYNKGQVITIATMLWYGYFKDSSNNADKFMSILNDEYKMSLHELSDNNIKIATLRGKNGLILFLFNYTDNKRNVKATLNNMSGKYRIKNLYKNKEYELSAEQNTLNIFADVDANDVCILKILEDAR